MDLGGEEIESEQSLLEIVGSGHPDDAPAAMLRLGSWHKAARRDQEARDWYQKAIGSDHADVAPLAMVELGEVGVGYDIEWLERAVDSGHPDVVARAWFGIGEGWAHRNYVEAAKAYEEAYLTSHADYGPRAALALGMISFMHWDDRLSLIHI